MAVFPFAQFDVPGLLGIDDGRYLVRDADGSAGDVVVFTSLRAPAQGRRRRRRRARDAGPTPELESLPATRITVVPATSLGGDGEAEAWLGRIGEDAELRETFLAHARGLAGRALHAHRAATMDPYVPELGPAGAAVVRVGFGDGESLADGRWTRALESPPGDEQRRRRSDALRPQERLAAVLGGQEAVAPAEALILRARLDLDLGREREAALGLEPALAGLIADLDAEPEPDQAEDLELLRSRTAPIMRVRSEAIRGTLSSDSSTLVGEVLAICERVLRRARILGA